MSLNEYPLKSIAASTFVSLCIFVSKSKFN